MKYRALKVIVAGSRNYTNYIVLAKKLDQLLKNKKAIILSGGARGADELGERYAKERGLHLIRKPANWKYGKHAGKIRNAEMAEEADALVAFWDGKSPGTQHMIETAKRRGLAVRIIKI